MNKKGFTLVELLAVIVVLSVIIGVASISAISIMNRSTDKTLKEMEDNLIDAAITCYLDVRDTSKCNSWSKLVENNYFEDDKEYCKNVTIEFDTSGNDYTAKIKTGSCKKS
jgi:prepilin-type N-terminal cleavage/methylation domain-containing protein